LRALGTALLVGVSVVSVVVGVAAQNTLGNVIVGFSLVLSGIVRIGDTIRLASSVGVISARVQTISLGYTRCSVTTRTRRSLFRTMSS